jgi:hypothetical protein
MMFLNLMLLFGAGAASIPLMIHLLNRSKYRIIDWGAMHFLEHVIEENHRRLRLYELLLLLIRCAIPVVLALCMARPLIQWLSVFAPGRQIQTVAVLDDSLSMGHKDGQSVTRFQRAKSILDQLNETLPTNANLQTITTHGSPLSQPLGGRFDPVEAIDQALKIVEKNPQQGFEVLIFSDFQSGSWNEIPERIVAEFKQRRDRLPIPSNLTLMQDSLVVATGGTTGNRVEDLRIERIDVSPENWAAGSNVIITASIAGGPVRAKQDIEIELLIDDQQVQSRRVPMSQVANQPVVFEYQVPNTPGHPIRSPAERLVTVRCRYEDDCDANNALSKVATIWNPVFAGVVASPGEPQEVQSVSGGPVDSGKFVLVALSPFAFSDQSSRTVDSVVASKINVEGLASEALSNLELLVLADPGKLDANLLRAVKDFVARGGRLMIFAGPKMESQLDWHNLALGSGSERLFPFTLANMVQPTDDDAAKKESTFRLARTRFSHPAMELFNQPGMGQFESVTFNRFVQIGSIDRSARVVASFDNGFPFAVEWDFGAGQVLFCASTADTMWTNLPLRSSFLPLIQSWVDYLLHSQRPPVNGLAGEAAAKQIKVTDQSSMIEIVGPLDNKIPYKIVDDAASDETKIVWTETNAVGAYRVSGTPDADGWYVTTSEEDEFTSDPLTGVAIDQLASRLDANVATSLDDYHASRSERTVGVEVWRWLWWLVLGLMVSERLVVWLSGGRA